EQEIYGQWMIDELAHHGYRLSPGTLYPMLHKMERDGYLVSRQEREGRTVRKLYTITPKGKEGLALAKDRIREFTGEAMHKGQIPPTPCSMRPLPRAAHPSKSSAPSSSWG